MLGKSNFPSKLIAEIKFSIVSSTPNFLNPRYFNDFLQKQSEPYPFILFLILIRLNQLYE